MKDTRNFLIFLFIVHVIVSGNNVPTKSDSSRDRKGVYLSQFNRTLMNRTSSLVSDFDNIGEKLLRKQNCLKKSCKRHKSSFHKRNKKISKRINKQNLKSTENESPDIFVKQGGGAAVPPPPAAPAVPNPLAPPNPFALLTIPLIGPILYTIFGFVIANLVLASTTRGEQVAGIEEAEQILQNVINFQPPGRKGANHTERYNINKENFKIYSTQLKEKIKRRQGINEHDSEMTHKIGMSNSNEFIYKPPRWLIQLNLALISSLVELVDRLS